MNKKFVVIDGNSLAYRAFYGLPPLMSNSGEPCNAIYGFCKMLINIIQKLSPEHMVIAFDAGKHTFRHDIFADYKGTRKPMPDDFRCQLPALKNLLKEMGLKVVEIPDIEADDIIGSVTRKFDEDMVVVSGDRDLLQLINDKVMVWLNIKGISDIAEMNIAKLKEKYMIEPYQVIEMKSIMGDASDNIPGVKGIGEKTAQKLIADYSSLDGIYENIDKITGKVHTLLVEQKEMAYMSHTLATIKTNVELGFSMEDCHYEFPFNRNVYDIMNNLGFKTIIQKSELFTANDNPIQIKEFTVDKKQINSIDKFSEFIKTVKENKKFALYFKNNNYNFAIESNEYIVDSMLPAVQEFYTMLGTILDDDKIEKTIFDVKDYKHYFKKIGITINNYFDVSLAIYIANESEGALDYEKYQEQNGLDASTPASNLNRLKNDLLKLMEERDQINLYRNIELQLIEVLYQMEIDGIKIDIDAVKVLSAQYKVELNNLTSKIYELVGSEFNINSPKQLQKVLFEDLKLIYKGKKSTNVDVLEAIQDQHPVIELILRYRKINKLVSTYLDGMLPYIDKDTHKIHTTYMQSFTTTGRLSSREPNLQNIPVRDDESKVLRKMFISSFENGNIMSADYNQIELRLMAIMSSDVNLLNDFKHKIDVHSMTASKIFGINPEDVKPAQRRMAKAVNFGIIYGISEYGLAKNIGVSNKEAKEFITKYFEAYPMIKDYMNKSIEFAKNNGYAKTLYNRIRHIPEIKADNYLLRTFGERVALNMPLQGTASDIIKMAMINVQYEIKKQKLNSKLILQIHDELILDVYPGEENICKELLDNQMTNFLHFELPLNVSIEYGKTWLDAK